MNSPLRVHVKEIRLCGGRYLGDFDSLSYSDLRRWLEDPTQASDVRERVFHRQKALCRLRNYPIDTKSVEETARMRVALMEEHHIILRQRLAEETSLQDNFSDLTKSQPDLTPSRHCLPACNTLSVSQTISEQRSLALPFQPMNLDPAWMRIPNKWTGMNTSGHGASNCTPFQQILPVQLPILRHLAFRGCSISPILLHAYLSKHLGHLETLELRDVVVVTNSYWSQWDSSGSWFGLRPLLQMAEEKNVCRLKLRGRLRNGCGYGWEFASCGQCDMSTTDKQPCCGLAIIEDAIMAGTFSSPDLSHTQSQQWQTNVSSDPFFSMSTLPPTMFRRQEVSYIEPKQFTPGMHWRS